MARLQWIALAFLTPLGVGCVGQPLNISDAPRIQDLKLVGSCLVLKDDLAVFQVGKPYRRLTFRPTDQRHEGGPGKLIATVPAGTRLHIVKIERGATYFDGLFSITSDLAFARIDLGEQAGKVIELGWRVMPRIDEVPPPFAPCAAGS